MIPVILSGGVGSRLWPLSRGMYPKQLLPIADAELSLLQQTAQRVMGPNGFEAITILCNEEHRFMVGEQLQQIGADGTTIMLEPFGRNTAPAIALAALHAGSTNPDAVLAVMPADHIVNNVPLFSESLKAAEKLAGDGALVTFGITPTHAETGYGYIRRGNTLGNHGFAVKEFREKPDRETAEQFIASKDYYWNSGIFVFKAQTFLEELKKFAPDVYYAAEKALELARPDMDFLRVDRDSFAECPSISIDYAVMEHTDRAAVMPLDVGWSDVGSWSALWDVSEKDEQGNVTHGDVIVHDSRNSHFHAQTKLMSAVGVDDLIVVETDDAVLVSHRERTQDVKVIVEALKKQGRDQVHHHRKVYRPWGWYDSIDTGDRFQVKRIMVKPRARLSIQMHHHRAEHWVVVSGTAKVLNGDRSITLNENQSTYIPIGTKHALSNPSDSIPLEIIEVQTGSYLGEDDIVRFEDIYGRAAIKDE